MQRVLRAIYPPQCVSCDALVDRDHTLCGACWRETPFISGLVCNRCGVPLPGEDTSPDLCCDACLATPRPWKKGRAALIYRGNARRMVLSLKHGDRQELAKPAAKWMLAAGQPLLQSGMVVAPVPAHWTRVLKRKYNQAALLAQNIARLSGLTYLPNALVRSRMTHIQDGMGPEARFRNVKGAIKPHNRNGAQMAGKTVLLVDDVMTSGATLDTATQACLSAGATQVCILVLARVAKDA